MRYVAESQGLISCSALIDQSALIALSRIVQDMMIYAAEAFTAHDIAYWLDYGSLLGAWRDHGIVPWEFDVDMGVREEVGEAVCRFAFAVRRALMSERLRALRSGVQPRAVSARQIPQRARLLHVRARRVHPAKSKVRMSRMGDGRSATHAPPRCSLPSCDVLC